MNDKGLKTKRGEFRSLVVVGIPTSGMVDIDFAVDLLNMSMPVNTSPTLKVIKEKPVDEACNLIVEFALKCNSGKGSDYIFFREDDVMIPRGAIEKLMARDEDIISGTCFSKQKPPFPIIFRTYGGGSYTRWYDEPGDVIEVCGVGVACTLIKTEVFRNIEPPWFKTITFTQTQPEVDDTKISRMTQDMYFFRKALAKGYRVWVDTGVQCGHKDVESGTIFYYDHDLRLPAWIGPKDTSPQCIAPVSRTLKAKPLSDKQRKKNENFIEESAEMDGYEYVRNKTGVEKENGGKSIQLDEDS